MNTKYIVFRGEPNIKKLPIAVGQKFYNLPYKDDIYILSAIPYPCNEALMMVFLINITTGHIFRSVANVLRADLICLSEFEAQLIFGADFPDGWERA
jgi:hypothetical protein